MTDPIARIEAERARRGDQGLFLEIATPEAHEVLNGVWACYPSSEAVKAKWRAGFIARGCFILQG